MGRGESVKVGDVVVPIKGAVLACGSGRYTHAICMGVTPFVLVSEEGDMVWTATVEPQYFQALCQAHPDIVEVCRKRLENDSNQRRKDFDIGTNYL